MGVNADAILFYGVASTVEDLYGFIDKDLVAKKLGWDGEEYRHEPSDKIVEDGNDYLQLELGIYVDCHCMESAPMFYVAIVDSMEVACRGSRIQLNLIELQKMVQPDWDERIERVLEALSARKGEPCHECYGSGRDESDEPCDECNGDGYYGDPSVTDEVGWNLVSYWER